MGTSRPKCRKRGAEKKCRIKCRKRGAEKQEGKKLSKVA
jgi:hypothetical protein